MQHNPIAPRSGRRWGLLSGAVLLILLLANLVMPAAAQRLVIIATHPGGLLTLQVEDPRTFAVPDPPNDVDYWQKPGGRFRLVTGPMQPTGGDPTFAGDESRAIASQVLKELDPPAGGEIDENGDLSQDYFTSKLTVNVGGDHVHEPPYDIHVMARDIDSLQENPYTFWPLAPTAGSRDIFGIAQIPLDVDPEDINNAQEIIEVQHRFTMVHDALQIEYIVENKTDSTLPVGIRIFIDGQFGGPGALGDGAPIVLPDGRVITNETVLPDQITPTIPDTWVSADRPENPTVIVRGTLEGSEVHAPGMARESAGTPDEIGWGPSRNCGQDKQWDFTPNPAFGLEGEDWGYFVKWNLKDLGAKRSRRYVTYFGLGASTANYDPPYVLAAYTPTYLKARTGDDPATPETERAYLVDRHGRSPFPVYAYIENYYPSPLLDAGVRISLPEGLELDPPTQPHSRSVGTVRRNEMKSVSWTVRATAVRPGTRVIRFTGPLGRTVERKITIPALPVLQPLLSVKGIEMISIPYTFQFTDAEHVFQSLGSMHPGENALIRWDPDVADYRWFPHPFITNIEPGIGFWLLNRARETVYLPDDATEVPTDRAFSLSVQRGWNQIGNPFTATISLKDARVVGPTGAEYSMQEAVQRGLLLPTLFWYDPPSGEYRWATELSEVQLDPYQGYWLNAFEDITLQLPAPRLITPARTTTPPTSACTAPGDWRVELRVASGDKVRTQRCFGMAASAKDGLDVKDVLAPPPAITDGPVLTAELVQPGTGTRYMQDIRKISSGRTEWSLVVNTSAVDQPVTVSWPDLSGLPHDLVAVFEDTATGDKCYMRTTTSYTSRAAAAGGTRTFRIIVQPRGTQRTLVTAASVQMAPSGASIVYTLASDATVEAEIMNISGIPIRRIASGKVMSAGVNTLAWDGRNGQGAPVPGGRYLCRVTARSPMTGEQHSVVRAFEFVR